MVLGKNIKIKYALISVYDKSNLKYLCENLKKHKYKFISTGSTCKKIRSLGYNCKEISKITGSKEILDGRVKTLHPKIYGSILYIRNNKKHEEEFVKLHTPKINLVIVNLYPFEKFFKKQNPEETIEMIDIGGPSLLRASSKNFTYVTTICNKNDYSRLIKNLNSNNGNTSIEFRREMASKTFLKISKYDSLISSWLGLKKNKINKVKLRYGENPNQNSFILENGSVSIFDNQLNGKNISYNNILDIDSGVKCIAEFLEPTCLIVKHNNPCGVASSSKIEIAFKKALECDNKSSFGGIILVNKLLNKKLAELVSKNFFEAVVAPAYNKDALKILTKKKNLILIKLPKMNIDKEEKRQTIFGTIYQNRDTNKINRKFCKLVAHKKVSHKLLDDILFASKVVKHLKSNAIVLAANKQTLGLGIGQTNRVDSINIALQRYKNNFYNKKFVCVSDGFFPFTDSLKLLKRNNCNIVAQPSGSIKDKDNIEYAKKNNISFFFLKNRLFKH